MEDYVNYCSEMGLLPDRRKWLRVVPCGKTYELNAKWNMYYQPTDRGYSPFHYLGIYTGKAVRLAGTVAAVYDSEEDVDGAMALKFVEGADRPEYRERIRGMVLDTKASVGWDLTSGMRFFCADPFALTEYQKKSPGGIQGARYLDVSEPAQLSATDGELAERLRMLSWE